MKMIRIIEHEKAYEVDAEEGLKLFGRRILSWHNTYFSEKDSNSWAKLPHKTKVSVGKEKKLNKWIRDHKRFVTKRGPTKTPSG